MSSPVFVDSVAWIALLHSADSLHEQTVQSYRKLVTDARDFVTTSFVLVEVANVVRTVATTLSDRTGKTTSFNCDLRTYLD